MAAIETPLLSVIIPMYNAQNTIKRCILSVCRENMNNIEIICVDDGSTDRSASIVEEMSKSDRRIQLIKQPNRSAGAARNCGLLQAQGKYVHFLDADDQICQGIYSREISSIQKHNADICIFQYMSYDGVTEKLRKRHCLLQHKRITSFEEDPAFFIYNMVISCSVPKYCIYNYIILS